MGTKLPGKTRQSAAALLCALAAGTASAGYALNLTEGVTSISREAYRLHMLALWVCVVIAIVVFGAMAWSIYHHRKSRGAVAASFHDNTRVEIVWTILPFLVLVGLAIPATTALIAMHDTSNADLTIKITGQQWSWRYDYLKEDIGFVSNLDEKSAAAAKLGSGVDPRSVEHYLLNVDKPLVVPVGKKVRFLLNASDVIHSWWLPDLGFKKDAIPGFVNEIWARIEKPGIYRGQCTELCGVGHGFMPIVLIAMNEPDYQAWLTAQREAVAKAKAGVDRVWTKEELLAKGEEVYAKTCAACHLPGGEGIPGAFKALKGSTIVKGPVADHIDRVMNGKPGTAMPSFAAQLDDADIAAVITHERNAWGNNMGDLVQPAQIKAARK
ncbi:cytochrome c oxidase subunit II [Sulfuritalea hydrogenivorans]|uniref:Cytochrome c oxidase subunit 2 n=1 Tax=Sulfuritalea hydrogenivorans sk43H TaxID=1223802 RepID=W0SE90_9PROT|nr:cytochrome c oxidase subunit II [Sulfuritalea hydrogenivorans]BAO29544.1 cytochrome c oxidase subunit II [Sulfuritalea hydrogenivorans sk43H]